jgi:hypothetical protein
MHEIGSGFSGRESFDHHSVLLIREGEEAGHMRQSKKTSL